MTVVFAQWHFSHAIAAMSSCGSCARRAEDGASICAFCGALVTAEAPASEKTDDFSGLAASAPPLAYAEQPPSYSATLGEKEDLQAPLLASESGVEAPETSVAAAPVPEEAPGGLVFASRLFRFFWWPCMTLLSYLCTLAYGDVVWPAFMINLVYYALAVALVTLLLRRGSYSKLATAQVLLCFVGWPVTSWSTMALSTSISSQRDGFPALAMAHVLMGFVAFGIAGFAGATSNTGGMGMSQRSVRRAPFSSWSRVHRSRLSTRSARSRHSVRSGRSSRRR